MPRQEAPQSSATATLSTRIPEIDILRGIAIAAVVGLHSFWEATTASDLLTPAGHAIAFFFLLCGFGVPLFLALSTAGLALGHREPSGWREHIHFLQPRILRLLPAYLLWSLISAYFLRPEVFGSFRSMAAMLVRGTADAQFYFVRLLIEIYVLWPLFRPLARASARSAAAAVAIASIGIAVAVGWGLPIMNGWFVRSMVMEPMLWLGFLVLGVAAAPYLPRLTKLGYSRTALAIVAILTAAASLEMDRNFYLRSAPTYVDIARLWASIIFQPEPTAYIVCAIGLLTLVAGRIRGTVAARWLTVLGSHSYGIFLSHLLILHLVVHTWFPLDNLRSMSAPLAFATTMVCWIAALGLSGALVALLSRSAWTRPFVSNRW